MHVDDVFEGLTAKSITTWTPILVLVGHSYKLFKTAIRNNVCKFRIAFKTNIMIDTADSNALYGKRRLAVITEAKNHGLQICRSDGCSWSK